MKQREIGIIEAMLIDSLESYLLPDEFSKKYFNDKLFEKWRKCMKYKELVPNVKWNCSSSKNTNILILCHPQQIPYYLSKLKDYIWERFSNVTIWQSKMEVTDKFQLLKEVEHMDAVICFVTELFMSSSNKIVDFLFLNIIKLKKPVLPIVVGEGLENVFDKKYSHIHFIKCKDIRKLRYDMIEEFVRGIQVTRTKQHQWFEVQDARFECFSQSFFISYRKVDGKYIDYVQRKIHKEMALIDTQLWYDSYLVPGENYDENLIKMINKCSVILLLVTSHLLESDHYVKRVEMRYAKKFRKPVVAILMEKMEKKDLEALFYQYGIDKVYDLREWKSFTDILSDANIQLPDVEIYPQRLVRIGMAYMNGMHIERNVQIACELLYQATKYSYLPAFEKLLEIKTGEYEEEIQRYEEAVKEATSIEVDINILDENTEYIDNKNFLIEELLESKSRKSKETYKDYEEAVTLFEDYIYLLKSEYKEQKNENAFISLLDCLRKYGEFCLKEEKLDKAYKHLLEFYGYVKDLDKKGPNKFCTYLSIASMLVGKTLNEMGEYKKAEKYIRKSVDIDRMLNNDNTMYNSITYTNLLTSLCELGNFYQKRGEFLKAKIMYEEVLITIQNTGTFYTTEWESDKVYDGYDNEETAKKTSEAERFAIISLWEIQREI